MERCVSLSAGQRHVRCSSEGALTYVSVLYSPSGGKMKVVYSVVLLTSSALFVNLVVGVTATIEVNGYGGAPSDKVGVALWAIFRSLLLLYLARWSLRGLFGPSRVP